MLQYWIQICSVLKEIIQSLISFSHLYIKMCYNNWISVLCCLNIFLAEETWGKFWWKNWPKIKPKLKKYPAMIKYSVAYSHFYNENTIKFSIHFREQQVDFVTIFKLFFLLKYCCTTMSILPSKHSLCHIDVLGWIYTSDFRGRFRIKLAPSIEQKKLWYQQNAPANAKSESRVNEVTIMPGAKQFK